MLLQERQRLRQQRLGRFFGDVVAAGQRLAAQVGGHLAPLGQHVEAALDDTNLGRLLEIYQELRTDSQLLVITHQKRTMEIADALYGITMRSDGVSAVISQRLREA